MQLNIRIFILRCYYHIYCFNYLTMPKQYTCNHFPFVGIPLPHFHASILTLPHSISQNFLCNQFPFYRYLTSYNSLSISNIKTVHVFLGHCFILVLKSSILTMPCFLFLICAYHSDLYHLIYMLVYIMFKEKLQFKNFAVKKEK